MLQSPPTRTELLVRVGGPMYSERRFLTAGVIGSNYGLFTRSTIGELNLEKIVTKLSSIDCYFSYWTSTTMWTLPRGEKSALTVI